MKLHAKEVDFSHATILLGDSITQQLVESSRRCRKAWTKLFEQYSGEIERLMGVSQSQKTICHPLVKGFIRSWASHTSWGLRQPLYSDALALNVPQGLIDQLQMTGGVESFLFFIGDIAEFCCAQLQSGDGHNEYRLFLNAPAWLKIASLPIYQDTFEQQLASVIQHEMAHFRHTKSGARAEIHAHCRGLASVLPRNWRYSTTEHLYAVIESECPEFPHNQEFKNLILNGSEVTSRLIRRWHSLFATSRNSNSNYTKTDDRKMMK